MIYFIRVISVLALLGLFGCQSTYYNMMERVGVHKRDILIDRVGEAQEAQQEGQEQFKSALEQFRSVIDFEAGELEDAYNRLNDEYEHSVDAANRIRDRIDAVESVAGALFDEWEAELDEYTNASLRRNSQQQLRDTRRRYERLISAMHRAESAIDPVLASLKDNVLYLKHNLNARAIAALKGELATIDTDVASLIATMEDAIRESDQFIHQLRGDG